mmetsp:Transcript_14282/g.43138  ORF Transcript_14282/g.43138 Transcript_14282/m.43138 type:complete len:108 (-) Transcript_14282:1163-1486(-)
MVHVVAQTFGSTGVMLVALGGSTLILTSGVMAAGRAIHKQQRRKHAVSCKACEGKGLVLCSVCRGKLVLKWTPFKEPQTVERPTCCPACEGEAKSRCVNCLGEGIVY